MFSMYWKEFVNPHDGPRGEHTHSFAKSIFTNVFITANLSIDEWNGWTVIVAANEKKLLTLNALFPFTVLMCYVLGHFRKLLASNGTILCNSTVKTDFHGQTKNIPIFNMFHNNIDMFLIGRVSSIFSLSVKEFLQQFKKCILFFLCLIFSVPQNVVTQSLPKKFAKSFML